MVHTKRKGKVRCWKGNISCAAHVVLLEYLAARPADVALITVGFLPQRDEIPKRDEEHGHRM